MNSGQVWTKIELCYQEMLLQILLGVNGSHDEEIDLIVHAGWLPSCRIEPCALLGAVFWCLNVCSLDTFLSQAPGTIQVPDVRTEQ